MKYSKLLLVMLLAISFSYAGCKSGDGESENPVEEVIEETQQKHEEMEEEIDKSAPPKLAAELWGLIHTEDYQTHWQMLPGKEAFYETTKGTLVTTYLNDIAYKAVEHGGEMPPGSMIVNENYNLEKELQSISLKANIPGYDNGEEGWFGVTYDPGGNPISYD